MFVRTHTRPPALDCISHRGCFRDGRSRSFGLASSDALVLTLPANGTYLITADADHLGFVSEDRPGGCRIQRWAAANAATPTAPVNQRARCLGRGAIAFRRIARRRSFAGIQRVKNAKASDAQCGHRSSVWSSSQSRHSRASCRCIRIVYPLGPLKLLLVGVPLQLLIARLWSSRTTKCRCFAVDSRCLKGASRKPTVIDGVRNVSFGVGASYRHIKPPDALQ